MKQMGGKRESTIIGNGTRKTKHVPYAWGEPQNPMTPEEHQHKFDACATGILGITRARELLSTLEGLDKLDDVLDLAKLLSPKK